MKLLLTRAGIFSFDESHASITVCPKHRADYGIRWRCRRVHLDKVMDVANHCIVFSLSDNSDPDFKQLCDHKHEHICDQCQALAETLTQIERCANDCHFPIDYERDEALYTIQSATLSIQSWKCHILRSLNQDQARFDALGLLDQETVLIVNDWAMKFLPQKYRESQSDWFGKRGISWHISVVYQRIDDKLQWQGFIHIIQSCSQASGAVVSIMQDVLRTLKQEYPEIKKAHFRQDNAGCYHASTTILACSDIAQSTGVEIARLDFSDPQWGKGAADRLAATCKAHIRRFINERNDVTTAKQLEAALLSHGSIEGIRVVSMESIQDAVIGEYKQKIPNISKLNNFEFNPGYVKVWRAYDIGSGKVIKTEKPSSASHCIQCNVCAMVQDSTLKNLKLGMLQLMCESLGLFIPKRPVRRKAPYLALLNDAVNNCSCQQ
ncbi:hypothetical protein QZH41_009788 [Actinostola sp. cb2023]|nr:hypothetical protein QZH41_009788 [Actinostola sp. cb2023]